PVGLPATPIWVTPPPVVILATSLMPGSAAQTLPSVPAAIREGVAPAGSATWVTAPPGRATFATECVSDSVTHRLPSDPAVIRTGPLPTGSPATVETVCVVGSILFTVWAAYSTK